MARLGKRSIQIPQGVKIELKDEGIIVTGPKGKLSRPILPLLKISLGNNQLKIEKVADNRKADTKADRMQGLFRSLLVNMIKGVVEGFEQILEIHGVGYKAEIKEKKIVLTLGFSHPFEVSIPNDISVEIVRNVVIFVRGIDKEQVGNFSASLRAIYPPEPYKGKGVRYRDEYVRHKVGKAAATTTT